MVSLKSVFYIYNKSKSVNKPHKKTIKVTNTKNDQSMAMKLVQVQTFSMSMQNFHFIPFEPFGGWLYTFYQPYLRRILNLKTRPKNVIFRIFLLLPLFLKTLWSFGINKQYNQYKHLSHETWYATTTTEGCSDHRCIKTAFIIHPLSVFSLL